MSELRGFFAACRAEGAWPGGVHLEFTGDDVTECVGGGEPVAESDLGLHYSSLVDPRLNARQSLDVAFQVAELLQPGSWPVAAPARLRDDDGTSLEISTGTPHVRPPGGRRRRCGRLRASPPTATTWSATASSLRRCATTTESSSASTT